MSTTGPSFDPLPKPVLLAVRLVGLLFRLVVLAGWLWAVRWLVITYTDSRGLPPHPTTLDWIIPALGGLGALSIMVAIFLSYRKKYKIAAIITAISTVLMVVYLVQSFSVAFMVGSMRNGMCAEQPRLPGCFRPNR